MFSSFYNVNEHGYWQDNSDGIRQYILLRRDNDADIIKEFNGTHPKIVQEWLPKELGLFQVDPNYQLTKKQKKHRIMLKLEKLFDIDLSKKHYKLV